MKRNVCLAAIVLWILTLTLGGWFFVKGWTVKGTDGRTEILLATVERDQILAEMRQLLKAVDGIVRELGESNPDLKRMEIAARAVGMHMAADVEPAIMAKLPLPFKQIGMSIHKDMDALADAIVQNETPQKLLKRLAQCRINIFTYSVMRLESSVKWRTCPCVSPHLFSSRLLNVSN